MDSIIKFPVSLDIQSHYEHVQTTSISNWYRDMYDKILRSGTCKVNSPPIYVHPSRSYPIPFLLSMIPFKAYLPKKSGYKKN